MVIYGGQDPFTPPAWTERALKQACGLGDAIRIEKQPDIRPDGIDVERAMPWITAQFLGDPPVDDCAAFTEPPPAADESYDDASYDESYDESEEG